MDKNHSSQENPIFSNACAWACTIGITVLAVLAIFQVILTLQSHITEEIAAVNLSQQVVR